MAFWRCGLSDSGYQAAQDCVSLWANVFALRGCLARRKPGTAGYNDIEQALALAEELAERNADLFTQTYGKQPVFAPKFKDAA